ncbi:MAG: oxygen-independent coproporphyrinogen III oxidase [Lachnospiraceae bacterium]|nr:oxygen-independent coproporphyrinogen III oxidase [Lachnospiraceae bacterium]
MKNNKKAEIYIHVPFCARKCAYCDFVSFVEDDDTKKAYFDALKKEIIKKTESIGKIPVDSVFFGGGTPSLVDERLILSTMDTIRDVFLLEPDAEITMEMNPDSVKESKLKAYREAGINRVSLGLQSTDNDELKLLSRIHDYETFLRAYEAVRTEGFNNVNIDLMSGLPGQDADKFKKTLERVIALKPQHISAYSLIIEENTLFYDKYKDGMGLPTEDTDREIYHMTGDVLKSAGFLRYEISNYALPGYECRHNIGYWTRKDYLGFGIAAASLYENVRFSHTGNLKDYINGNYTQEKEVLSKLDQMEEFMFLGLRLIKGVSKDEFKQEFNESMDSVYGSELVKLEKEGLIVNSDRVYLTELGLDLANYAMSQFIK